MSKLVKLEMVQYGLAENKAEEIKSLYLPFIASLENFEAHFNKIVTSQITEELTEEARRLRLDLRKIRTSADKVRKDAKAEFLRANKAIQGAYNTVEYFIVSKEDKLKEIEEHYERIEKEKIQKIQDERANELLKYNFEDAPQYLGTMEVSIWEAYRDKIKRDFEILQKAEKEAEEKRQEEERIKKLTSERKEMLIPYWNFLSDMQKTYEFGSMVQGAFENMLNEVKEKAEIFKKEQEAIRIENERLRKEKEKKEEEEAKKAAIILKRNKELHPYTNFIEDYHKTCNLPEEEYQKKLNDLKEAKHKHDIEEAKKKAEEKKKEEEKQRLEELLREKEEEEERERLRAEEEKQNRLQASDKEKLIQLAKDIKAFKFPEVESVTANKILKNAKNLLDKTNRYIIDKSSRI